MTSLPYCPPTGKTQDKAKELRARIDDSLSALAGAVDEVRASDTFRQYLEVQARLRRVGSLHGNE